MPSPPVFALALVSALFVAVGSAFGQERAACEQREREFTAEMTASLRRLADAFAAERQHGTALRLRKEVLLDYAPDDVAAREAMGFVRVGDGWQVDPGRFVVDRDFPGSARSLRKLRRELSRFRKEQLRGHRELAELWHRVGDDERAAAHWRRVLVLDPKDRRALEAVSARQFAGYCGTDDELHRLRRSWAIRGAVSWLHDWDVPVRPIEGRSHPVLERAGVAHRGFRTESFEVWGKLPPDDLRRVAQDRERALWMFATIFGVSGGHAFEPAPMRGLVLVGDDATYRKVLEAHAEQFGAGRLRFLLENVDMAFVAAGESQVRVVKTNGSLEQALDQAVRGVGQDLLACESEGLWEGVGHAACGFFYGRTITFLVEQRDEHTVSSWASDLLVPELEVWRQIAEKSAWAESDTRTSELVLLRAARFSTEQRVKAWSICDYLFRWRPELVAALDRSRTEEHSTPPAVEREFERRTGVSLVQIDRDWREFWTRKEALRKAMFADPLGEDGSKERERRVRARPLVSAVNALRVAGRRGPVGFYFATGAAVDEALAYGKALRRVERARRRRPKAEIPDPPRPEAIGRDVLFARGDPAASVMRWWADPALRDAMLHPGRGLLGAVVDERGSVLDLSTPVRPTRSGPPQSWPRRRQQHVPRAAAVADVGPRAREALAAAGKGDLETVAMPFTLHFARAVPEAELRKVSARVYRDGRRFDGVLVCYQGGAAEDAADGCVAFVGFEPPPPGAELEVEWELPDVLLAGAEPPPPARFLVQ